MLNSILRSGYVLSILVIGPKGGPQQTSKGGPRVQCRNLATFVRCYIAAIRWLLSLHLEYRDS